MFFQYSFCDLSPNSLSDSKNGTILENARSYWLIINGVIAQLVQGK